MRNPRLLPLATTALTLALACGGSLPPPAGPTSAVWRFDARTPPLFFAVQDGNGAWQEVQGTEGTYAFTFQGASGGVAYLPSYLEGEFPQMTLAYGSSAELASSDLRPQALTVTGTATGLEPGEQAYINLGLGTRAWKAVLGPGSKPWQYRQPAGRYDLIALRLNPDDTANSLILHRDLDLQAAGPLGPQGDLDFSAAGDSVPLLPATLSIDGIAPNSPDTFSFRQAIVTNHGDAYLAGGLLETNNATAKILAAPAGLLRSREGYRYEVTTYPADSQGGNNLDRSRTVSVFQPLGAHAATRPVDPSITVAPDMAAPLATALPGGAPNRLRLQWTFDATYNRLFTSTFFQNGPAQTWWNVSVTQAYGGDRLDLTLPDFSSLAGWKAEWNWIPGDPIDGFAEGRGSDQATVGPMPGAGRGYWARTTLKIPKP